MKKLATLVFGFLLLGVTAHAAHNNGYRYDGNAYVFIEGPVEFSVFPDGQFDFVYLGYDRGGNVNVNINKRPSKQVVFQVTWLKRVC